MPFVLDASVAACWLFDDEDHPHARHALARIRGDEAWGTEPVVVRGAQHAAGE